MRAAEPVEALEARVLSAFEARALGQSGLVISLKRTDEADVSGPVAVSIPDGILDGLFGADYGSRVQWVQVPASKPDLSGGALPVAWAHDESTATTLLTPELSDARVFVMPMNSTSAATGTGDYAATPLAQSALWDVTTQTGAFTWSYPLRTPPAPAGPVPVMALNYDSQSVDGKTGSTNNQSSAIGEGWSLSAGGFIEQRFVSCSSDDGPSGAVAGSGDLCWKSDNATASFAGHGGALIRDSSGEWRLQDDDGSRVEHLVGTAAGCGANGTYDDDCWRITTSDGTRYYFGLERLPGWSSGDAETDSTWTVPVYGNDPGEPCHASTFAASSCVRAWRWNLDYVVDSHGNAQALYYNAETNSYARNGGSPVSYVRGGQLNRIDYGFRDGTATDTNAATGRVTFTYSPTGRCSDSTGSTCSPAAMSGAATSPAHPSSYPDVPFDLLCSTSCATSTSPSFWTNASLDRITTSVLSAGTYAPVDRWDFGHSFPDPGDGTSPSLWLTQIVHTGLAGGSPIAEPPTVFTGIPIQNRVWPIDGLAPLDKYRVASIATSGGATITVTYSPQECTPENSDNVRLHPESNSMRCFPQWWSPDVVPPQAPWIDLFHKYVVTSVTADGNTGGGLSESLYTEYVYTGTPAWRYDDSELTQSDRRTWSEFAGYDAVEIRVGSNASPATQEVSQYTFFRGMDGDRAAPSGGTRTVYVAGSATVRDSLWFAGEVRSLTRHNGVGGAILSTTTNTLWASSPTANNGVETARYTGMADVTVVEPLAGGGSRTGQTVTTFEPTTGLPVTVSKIATGLPSTCTTTTYAAPNTTTGVHGLAARTTTVAKGCADIGNVSLPDDAISDTRNSYDGGSPGAAASEGNVTRVETVDRYDGATPHWVTVYEYDHDALGRPTSVTDALGRTQTTTYTPSAGAPTGSGPLTSITATSPAPFNWSTTTTFNPAWNLETSSTDPNGRVTSSSYDALGRLVGVWYSDHTRASFPSQPSVAYSYGLSTTSPNWISTTTLVASAVVTNYALYDGLGRQVQTQGPAEGGGSVVTDTAYDSVGRPYVQNDRYWAPSVSPSGALFVPLAESQIPSRTITEFDGAGRPTATILRSLGVERSRVTVTYSGADRADTIPPPGGTPTSTYSDAAGQQTKLVQYLGATISPSTPHTDTTYDYDVSGNLVGMTDDVGNEWAWDYDLVGRLVSSTDPDSGTTTNTYDTVGNLLTVTDAESKTSAFKYDEINRKIAKYEGSVSGPILASWTYDTLAKGQLTSATQYVGSTASTPGMAYRNRVNSYDAGYRPTSTTVSLPAGAPAFGGSSYTTTYTYFANGALSTVLYPAMGGIASERLRFSYNGIGRPSGIVGLSSYGTAEYTAIGQLSLLSRFGATSLYSDYGYDPATGDVLNVTNTTEASGTFTQIRDSSYTYDLTGNVTSIESETDTGPNDKQCYLYDTLANLTDVWTPGDGDCAVAPSAASLGGPAPYWNTYAIDEDTGNRLSVTRRTPTAASIVDEYTYPSGGGAHPHAVGSVVSSGGATTTESYSYDASGNTVARPGQTLEYDVEGHLAELTTAAGTQTNVYNAAGSLILQVDPTEGATLYLGETRLRKPAGSSTVSAQRVYSIAGTSFAERSTLPGAVGVVWSATDPQGTSTDQVVASSGARTSLRLDPFGEPRGGPAAWANGNGFLNAPSNVATGLTQLGIRLYDSTLGRFLSVDPMLSPGLPQQNNGYSYAANNPTTRSDPSGGCFKAPKHGCTDSKKSMKGSSSAPSKPSAKKPAPAQAASQQQEQWWNPFSWSATTWQDVGAVAAGVAVGVGIVVGIAAAVGCTAVTFGVCGAVIIAAGVAAGAAGAAVTYALQSGDKSWEGLGQSVVVGAAFGGLGALAGPVVGAVGSRIATALGGAIRSGSAGAAAGAGAAGGAPSVIQTAIRLQSHVANAVSRFDQSLLSDAQQAAIKLNPSLAQAFRGTWIDDAVKAAVDGDSQLGHLMTTGKGLFGPDFVDIANGIWYDITTPGSFLAHLNRYADLGSGIGLFTK